MIRRKQERRKYHSLVNNYNLSISSVSCSMKHDDTEHSLRDECDGRCPHQYLSCSKESFSFDMVLDFYRNGTQLGNSFSELICIDFYV